MGVVDVETNARKRKRGRDTGKEKVIVDKLLHQNHEWQSRSQRQNESY